VRVEALVRQEAADVRRSAARLVTVNDVERHALAERLRTGAIARLERVRAALRQAGRGDVRTDGRAEPSGPVAPVIEELDRVIAELDRLASGLNPAMVHQGSLRVALQKLADGAGLPVGLDLDGDVDGLPVDAASLVYFVVAECLTNVVRHAQATRARVAVRVGPTLVVEVEDNGRGGASIAAGRGLQGLADRVAVAGGTFDVASPVGGPTVVRAEIPAPIAAIPRP
jgi:signal transduction histidine kinase